MIKLQGAKTDMTDSNLIFCKDCGQIFGGVDEPLDNKTYICRVNCNNTSGRASAQVFEQNGGMLVYQIDEECYNPYKKPTVKERKVVKMATCQNMVKGACSNGFSNPEFCDTCVKAVPVEPKKTVGAKVGGTEDLQQLAANFQKWYLPEPGQIHGATIQYEGNCACCNDPLRPGKDANGQPIRMWGLVPTKNHHMNKKTGARLDRVWICNKCYSVVSVMKAA